MTLPSTWPAVLHCPGAGEPLIWRAMVPGDVDRVQALDARAYAHPWTQSNFSSAITDGYVCLCLCRSDGGLLGHLVAMRGVEEMHLLNITVGPEFQGRGLGSAMLQDLAVWAQSERAHAIWLEVRHSNERAKRLYLRHGYERVGMRKAYYPAGREREDAWVMRRWISMSTSVD